MDNWDMNAFYLPAGDYLVLAALYGLDELQSVFRVRQEPMTEQDVYYALHHLLTRGIIDENKELLEPYGEIFGQIFGADRVWVLFRKDSAAGPLCCYPGKRIVLTEASGTDRNAVRIRTAGPEGLPGELGDVYPFPEEPDAEEGTPPESALIGRLMRSPAFTGSDGAEPRWEEAVWAVLEEFGLREKQVKRRIFFLETNDGFWILDIGGGPVELYPYGREKLTELLSEGAGDGDDKEGQE